MTHIIVDHSWFPWPPVSSSDGSLVEVEWTLISYTLVNCKWGTEDSELPLACEAWDVSNPAPSLSLVRWGFHGNWLVVSTPLKNISQIGSSSQLLGKIKNVPNHHQPGNLTREKENGYGEITKILATNRVIERDLINGDHGGQLWEPPNIFMGTIGIAYQQIYNLKIYSLYNV